MENIVITELMIWFLPPDLTLIESELMVLGVLGYSRTQHGEWYQEGVLSVSGHRHLEDIYWREQLCWIAYCHSFQTHYSWCVWIEEDIWKVFPDHVFIAGICCANKTISSEYFYIMVGLRIIQFNAMNQFPINCDSIISLLIIIFQRKFFFLSPFLMILMIVLQWWCCTTYLNWWKNQSNNFHFDLQHLRNVGVEDKLGFYWLG